MGTTARRTRYRTVPVFPAQGTMPRAAQRKITQKILRQKIKNAGKLRKGIFKLDRSHETQLRTIRISAATNGSPTKAAWRAKRAVRRTRSTGGGRGIRTPDSLSAITVFKTAGINRSPIPPRVGASICRPELDCTWKSACAATVLAGVNAFILPYRLNLCDIERRDFAQTECQNARQQEPSRNRGSPSALRRWENT